jgi:hypothetical protein
MNPFRVDDLGAMPASRLALRIAALVLASAARCAFAQSAPAEAEADEAAGAQTAAAQAQNPIAHVISVPFQNNALTRTGPYRKTADTLLIQPVIPIRIDDNWSVITRTIVPVVYLPRTSPEQGEVTGLGNIEPQFYFTPARRRGCPRPARTRWASTNGAAARPWSAS